MMHTQKHVVTEMIIRLSDLDYIGFCIEPVHYYDENGEPMVEEVDYVCTLHFPCPARVDETKVLAWSEDFDMGTYQAMSDIDLNQRLVEMEKEARQFRKSMRKK